MFPQADLAQLAVRIFRVLSQWNWQEPLCLLPYGTSRRNAPTVLAPGGSRSDAKVSVLLPLDNPLCATPNVTDATTKVSQRELQHGFQKTQQVELMSVQWEKVCSTGRFFQSHRHYLELDFMAASPAVFASWQSWGRQQTQNLVQLFESTCSNGVTLRPWPAWIKDATWPYACALFVGVHLKHSGDDQGEGRKCSVSRLSGFLKL